MKESFQTVQPDVPPRDDSFGVTAVYSKDELKKPDDRVQRRSLIEVENSLIIPRASYAGASAADPQLSPRLGGPGSAFKPYASSENLYDPSLFGASKLPFNGNNGNNVIQQQALAQTQSSAGEKSKRYSTSSLKPPAIVESEEEFFKPKPSPKSQRSSKIFSTTDTEPEMKEFNLAPIGSDRKSKKFQKPIYSTSETEEEYQAYLKMKPKWHSKGGHKDSWDPMQIASPPQLVQKPVGLVQKPKPQPQVAPKVERGAEVYPVSLQIYPGNGNVATEQGYAFLPPNMERIQKSDSIIEIREKNMAVPSYERIQKSNSVVEVVPVRKISQVQQQQSLDEAYMQHSIIRDSSAFQAPPQRNITKESSPYYPPVAQQQEPFQPPQRQTIVKESSPYKPPNTQQELIVPTTVQELSQPLKQFTAPVKELSPYENVEEIPKRTFTMASQQPDSLQGKILTHDNIVLTSLHFSCHQPSGLRGSNYTSGTQKVLWSTQTNIS